MTMKFKVTIERLIQEEYEMALEDENVVKALDEALKIVAARNVTNKVGRFFVTKIETVEK